MSGHDIRPGEQCVVLPATTDARLVFIGHINTPWTSRAACPRRGDPVDGPLCRLTIFPPWREALAGLDGLAELDLLYWMHLARRDLVVQVPRSSGRPHGTFALRSPMRPNPIAASAVRLIAVEADGLMVRGLDCVDGTPLLDIKPRRCSMWPDPASRPGE